MNNIPVFLPFDTETGGVGGQSSLLTVHFAICDANFNIMDELDLAVKPEDDHYVITAESLTINHIDLIEHDKIAIPYNVAGGKLRAFLEKNNPGGKYKLIPVGKNIGFDVKKVCPTLLGEGTFFKYVSYRNYDITTMITLLKRQGRIPQNTPESLEGLANHLGIKFVAHTAKGDNHAGIEVVKWLEAQ